MASVAEVLMNPEIAQQITAVCAVLGLLGLIIGLITLQYSRSANFVAAWTTLAKDMQKENARAGRTILECLSECTPRPAFEDPDDGKWLRTFDELNANGKYAEACWFEPLKAETDPTKRAHMLQRWARESYDALDLAAILIFHSRIPGLLRAFMAEYQKAIITCKENGEFFLAQRIKAKRPDKYDCLRLLYELTLEFAKRRTEAERLYPHRPLIVGWPCPPAKRAAAERAHRRLEKLRKDMRKWQQKQEAARPD